MMGSPLVRAALRVHRWRLAHPSGCNTVAQAMLTRWLGRHTVSHGAGGSQGRAQGSAGSREGCLRATRS